MEWIINNEYKHWKFTHPHSIANRDLTFSNTRTQLERVCLKRSLVSRHFKVVQEKFIITHIVWKSYFAWKFIARFSHLVVSASVSSRTYTHLLTRSPYKTSLFFSILIIKLLKLSMNKKLSNGFPSHPVNEKKTERKSASESS